MYTCDICAWIYNEVEGYPENAIVPGTKWEDMLDDFVCPLCGVGKDSFSKTNQQRVIVNLIQNG